MNITQIKAASFNQKIADSKATVLLNANWEKVHGAGLLWFEIADSGTHLGFFNAYQYRKLGKSFLITPPGFPYCGFSFSVPSSEMDVAFKTKVLDAVCTFFSENFAKSYIDVGLPPELFCENYKSQESFSFPQLKNYQLDLKPNLDDILKQMSSNRRRNIKSVHKGYEVKVDAAHSQVLEMIDFVLEKIDSQKMRQVYESLFANRECISVTTILVSIENKPLASGIFLIDNNECFYFSGGHNSSVSDHNAGTICLWSAMESAKSKSVSTFNFCGSSIPSIERYFQSFGAKPVSYFRIKYGSSWIDKAKKVKEKFLK